jgi:hypothetical protein
MIWGIQGDCIFYKINEIPKDAKKVKTKVLIEGSGSGNKHFVAKGKNEIYKSEKGIYLSVLTPVTVSHATHPNVSLDKGKYLVDQPREMDHIKKMERKIID